MAPALKLTVRPAGNDFSALGYLSAGSVALTGAACLEAAEVRLLPGFSASD